MHTYRVRIRDPKGRCKVIDQSHSQNCELTQELTREQYARYLKGEAMDLADGHNIKLVNHV